MALVTRCPGCNTTFRVYAAQLQAHGGDLRCGQCQRVFNGFATLITVHESAIEYPVMPRTQSSSGAGSSATIQMPAGSGIPNYQPVMTDWDPVAAETAGRLFDDKEPVQPSSKGWGIASALLLLLLIAQATYHYRTGLTIIAPEIRPYLEQYCDLLGCTVAYPQEVEYIGIESSDLQKNPVKQPEITTMRAIICNYAPFPQALPALHLFLLDAQEQIIASRIFTAAEYLQEADKRPPVIAPQQEIEIRLDFDSTGLGALGYRLRLLYL